MSEPLNLCEYFLVEYAPSPLREMRIPVGLFLFDTAERLVQSGFTRNLRHVRCLDPQADITLLSSLADEFNLVLAEGARSSAVSSQQSSTAGSVYDRLRKMHEEFTGSIRVSSPKAVLTSNAEEEFQRLFREHLEPLHSRAQPHASGQSRTGSRRWIRAQLSDALERHNLADRLAKEVSVDAFTVPGDTFRINYAYRPNGVTKYLHAISLERDWNQAKLLSYTSWRIREKIPAQFTAVVADPKPDSSAVEGCRRILTDSDIQIRPLSALDPYLEEISRELGPAA